MGNCVSKPKVHQVPEIKTEAKTPIFVQTIVVKPQYQAVKKTASRPSESTVLSDIDVLVRASGTDSNKIDSTNSQMGSSSASLAVSQSSTKSMPRSFTVMYCSRLATTENSITLTIPPAPVEHVAHPCRPSYLTHSKERPSGNIYCDFEENDNFDNHHVCRR